MATNVNINTDNVLKGGADAVDDGNWSQNNFRNSENNSQQINNTEKKNLGDDIYGGTNDYLKAIYHAHNLYGKQEFRDAIYNDVFRFGVLNQSSAISTSREYLFFTKPDLHIMNQNELAICNGSVLNPALKERPFWEDMYRRKATIACLQESYNYGTGGKFNNLLQNMVSSNLDVPGLSAETIDTPTNMFGVNFSYRGSSEASDDNPEFSLEFKDTQYLDVFHFFKAYEEYETLKHHGVIAPSKYYIINKILHDQFSIFKFLVGEDMETIIYYGKMIGVMPKSLPREVFSSTNFDNGLTYSVDFKAAFYEDMRPEILADFNTLSYDKYNSSKYYMTPYNVTMGRADMRLAKAAIVVRDTTSPEAKNSPAGFLYKLKWKGDRQI